MKNEEITFMGFISKFVVISDYSLFLASETFDSERGSALVVA